jgi:hypothetical protein
MNLGPDAQLTLTLGTLVAVAGFVWRFSSRFAALELKANTVWDYLMRRGEAEGLRVGALTKNSPVSLTDGARERLAPLEADLKAWYRRAGRKLVDRDLSAALEKEFGQRIADWVAVPHGLHQGTCLLAAVLLCREVDSETP